MLRFLPAVLTTAVLAITPTAMAQQPPGHPGTHPDVFVPGAMVTFDFVHSAAFYLATKMFQCSHGATQVEIALQGHGVERHVRVYPCDVAHNKTPRWVVGSGEAYVLNYRALGPNGVGPYHHQHFVTGPRGVQFFHWHRP